MLRRYIVNGLNILMENTAVSAAYYSNGEAGTYIDMEYYDIVNPQPRKEQKRGQATESIRNKLR